MISNLINKTFIVASLCCVANLAQAASFEVMSSAQQIDNQQSVTITFKLADAKVRKEPDFTPLTKDFDIYSQGNSSSYSLINGNLSQSISWSLVLFPKGVGKFTIPKISVGTAKGTLTSQELEIEVVNNIANNSPNSINQASAASNNPKYQDVYLEGHLEDAHELYVNQPFVYTLKIVTRLPLANMMLSDLHSEDAIVERSGEPVQYNTLINGNQHNITEIKYIITPLKSGKITLNPASLKFEVLNSFFSRYNNAGTVYSEEEILKVLDIPGKIPPFSKLTLEDSWDISNAKEIYENDSLTRTIKLVGEDGYVDALKISLPEQTAEYNLYQDKTREDKSLSKNNHVRSEKIINYTIIPLKAGELILPKMLIKWWNVKKKQIEYLEIPEKRFQVLSSGNAASSIVEHSTLEPDKTTYNKYPILLIISLLLNLGFIAFYLFKYILKFKKHKKISLDEVKTTDELKNYINYFAQNIWKIKGNLPLKDLWLELNKANYTYNQDLAQELTNKLNSNLYFKEDLQLNKALELWQKFSMTVVKKVPVKNTTTATPSKLNPI